MASDYGRDPDQDARTFADRRGLSGEIRFAEPPERAKGEMPAAERGSPRQEREDPQKIARGERTAPAESPRRRGMLDAFRPARATDHAKGAKPNSGMLVRTSVAKGKSMLVRVEPDGRRSITKKNTRKKSDT